jgi:hypothetical protein
MQQVRAEAASVPEAASFLSLAKKNAVSFSCFCYNAEVFYFGD